MIELRRGQAHVWTLPVSPADDGLIESLRRILSDREKARAARISNVATRREFLAAHILVHQMLARFSDVAPARWHFVQGPHGRLEPSPEFEAYGLRFNISHTDGMVACALSRQDAIGVDVEWLKRSGDLEAIAEKKFAPPERALLKQAPAQDRQRVFLSLWTLKESYIKAIGKGLLEPLDGFAFTLEPPLIAFIGGQDDASRWHFDLSQPSPEHLLALALAKPATAKVDIHRRHLPMAELEAL